MVNDLVDGYMYFLENEGAWVPTVANIDLATDFTEGTEFCKLKIPLQWVETPLTGIKGDLASSGKGFMERTFRRGYILDFQATVDFTDLALIRQFFLSNDHTTSSPTSYVPYYLVMRRSVTEYIQFYNTAGSLVDYLKGAVPNGGLKYTWNMDKSLRAIVQIKFMGLW